jgi:hypothetical protein
MRGSTMRMHITANPGDTISGGLPFGGSCPDNHPANSAKGA